MIAEEAHTGLHIYLSVVLLQQPVHSVVANNAAAGLYLLFRAEFVRHEVVGVAHVFPAPVDTNAFGVPPC